MLNRVTRQRQAKSRGVAARSGDGASLGSPRDERIDPRLEVGSLTSRLLSATLYASAETADAIRGESRDALSANAHTSTTPSALCHPFF
jgi:hypothetical protein